MKTETLSPFPAGDNPFLHDLYHQGERIAKNCIVMFNKGSDKMIKYVIIVNPITGERLQIDLNGKES